MSTDVNVFTKNYTYPCYTFFAVLCVLIVSSFVLFLDLTGLLKMPDIVSLYNFVAVMLSFAGLFYVFVLFNFVRNWSRKRDELNTATDEIDISV